MNEKVMFIGMVFIAVFMLAQGLIISTTNKQTAKGIRRRMSIVLDKNSNAQTVSLLKERRKTVKWFTSVQKLIEHSGVNSSLQNFIIFSMVSGSVGGIACYLFTHSTLFSMATALSAGTLPYFRLRKAFSKKVNSFEEQLPDAIDIMVRSLRAGYPFNETLKLIGDEMKPPINKEFNTTFLDINYGTDVRLAFYSLMERVPSPNLLNLVTAVLIQRETGGNLAEVLENISGIIRGNFKFRRKVKTLSAEGRMSAWILVSVPFLLCIVLMVISPNYLPVLTHEPIGKNIILISFCLMTIGIYWISRLLKKVGDV